MEKLPVWGFILVLFVTGCKDPNNPTNLQDALGIDVVV